jgi:MFS family permease
MGIPLGVMAAYFATASLMGASNDDVNWREIFIFLGLTGIALAIIVKLVIKEPVRGAMEFEDETEIIKPPFITSVKTLLAIPAWRAMCFGSAFGAFVSYSASAFQTKYLIALNPDFDFKTLVIILGVINGTTYAGGAFFGARLADRWGKNNVRAYGWLPAIAIIICLPITLFSWWVPTVEGHLLLTTLFLLFFGTWLGPSFAIAQTLAPVNMRAMSTALFFFILNMISLGGGPTFTGWMIDIFNVNNDELESMRYAMSVTSLLLIPSMASFLLASRLLPGDWTKAEKANQELVNR